MLYSPQVLDAPRPAKLNLSVLEGTCGRLKRYVEEQGNLRIRDSCLRAKCTARESHLPVDTEVGHLVNLAVRNHVDEHIETIQQRGKRLQQLRRAHIERKNAEVLSREQFRKNRAEYIARIPLRFDVDEKWPRALLVEQAEARALKSCQNLKIATLVTKINAWNDEQPLERLREILRTRGIDAAQDCEDALRVLKEKDNALENYPQSAKVQSVAADGEVESNEDFVESEEDAEALAPGKRRRRE
eukprot:Hpha_TRINITY_DN15083_c0_g1::TRINITY_DN15083_c0_g1_i3::g.123262::m.123262